MQRPAFANFVTSSHARTGKTLLARILCENYFLGNEIPAIFDTDPAEHPLQECFPQHAVVVDLDRVTDQMALFDALAASGEQARVVDVTQNAQRKMMELLLTSDYGKEAVQQGVAPVIFYIPTPDPNAYEQGWVLRDRLPDCHFVTVESPHLGEVNAFTRRSVGFRALESGPLHMFIPQLDPKLTAIVDDPGFSIAGFMREAPADLSYEMRATLRDFFLNVFREMSRTLRRIEDRVADANRNATGGYIS